MQSSRLIQFFKDTVLPNKDKIPTYCHKPILDIKLYRTESNDILVGFDYISQTYLEPTLLPLRFFHHFSMKKYSNAIDHKLYYSTITNSPAEERTFDVSECYQDTIRDKASGLQYAKSSIIYKLPINSNAALNFISAFLDYINHNADNSACHLKEYGVNDSLDSFIKGMPEIENIMDYSKDNIFMNLQFIFIEKLLSMHLQKDDPYSAAFDKLSKVYTLYKKDWSEERCLPFACYASANFREVALHNLLNANIEQLINLARQWIHKAEPNKLKELLPEVNNLVFSELYSKLIGERAHDGGVYSYTYTEFDFLNSAKNSVTTTKDGKFSITDFDHNSGYLKYYAEGKQNYNIFIAEFLFLANLLGVAFENKEFHKEKCMIFDNASTEKLSKMGLIDVENTIQEVKKNIYKENFHRFFNKCEIDNDNGVTNILYLPKEVLALIQEKMEESRNNPTPM